MPDANLIILGGSFDRLKARWARQGRRVGQLAAKADTVAKSQGTAPVRRSGPQAGLLETAREEVGYHGAWARWSTTGDGLAGLVDQILHRPVATFSDLSIKFDALIWLLTADGAVLDRQAERQVHRFGRELRRLAIDHGGPARRNRS